jgi:hypothetical protein
VCCCVFLSVLSSADGVYVSLGRKRLGVVRPERALDNVRAIVEDVKKSGVFKTRKPEGKAGDY